MWKRAQDNRLTEKTTSIGASSQAAMLAGEEALAKRILVEDLTALYQHLQTQWADTGADGDELIDCLELHKGLERCSGSWKIPRDAKLGDALGVQESDLDEYVREGCALIKQRSIGGPVRTHATKSICELVQMMNQNMVVGSAGLDGGPEVATFRKPGGTEEQIAALEEHLSTTFIDDDEWESEQAVPPGKHLPDDYKDFLRAGNGIGEDIFYCAAIKTGDEDYDLFSASSTHLYGADTDFDVIPFGRYAMFSIGSGDGEGTVVLLSPESIRPVIERFEKAYANASEVNKRVYERAALDIYEGIEHLRALQWLAIEVRRPVPEVYGVWGEFKAYLQDYVERGRR